MATQLPKTQTDRTAYKLAYYLANRERLLARAREDRKNNPEKHKQYEQKRRTPRRSQLMRAGEERLREMTPWRTALKECKKRAKQRGLAFDLTDDWAGARWTGNCELTDLPFIKGDRTKTPFTASIDKREASLGYTQANCRFVLLAVNMLKYIGTDEQMFEIAAALTQRR